MIWKIIYMYWLSHWKIQSSLPRQVILCDTLYTKVKSHAVNMRDHSDRNLRQDLVSSVKAISRIAESL